MHRILPHTTLKVFKGMIKIIDSTTQVKVINKGNGSRGVPIYLVIFLLFVDQRSLLIIFLS
jgi:hypothetical protein